MKILYVNFAYDTWGHKSLDENYIRILSKTSEVYVIARKGWYKNLPNNVKLIKYSPWLIPKDCSNKYLQYFLSILVMRFTRQKQSEIKFDYTIAGTFNTITLLIGRRWFSKSQMYIVHHNNTDLLTRPIYRKIFGLYKLQFNHIVQEEFIKEYLISELKVPEKQLAVLPHPLNISYVNDYTDKYYDCVGISNSNDEDSIKQLVLMEKESHTLYEKKIRILLRTSSEEFSDEYLQIISGYLTPEQYETYISSAKSILIPFPNTFQYRESGSVIDALSNGIPVIGKRIRLIESYSERFPNICMKYENIQELPILLEKLNLTDAALKKRDFLKFMDEHSDEKILDTMKHIFA